MVSMPYAPEPRSESFRYYLAGNCFLEGMVMAERELVDMVLVRYWAGRLEEEDRQKLWQFLYGYDTNEFLCQDNGYVRENGA
jgi:hypothetical protein